MLQVLIDADNLTSARLAALVRALPGDARVTVAGSPWALAQAAWPRHATVVEVEGWQRADLVLVDAYRADTDPLVLASGDGDFAHLVAGHPGPVLVVADRPAAALRRNAPVVDPVLDGMDALRDWLDAVTDSAWEE